jgi:hypothetical protein
MIKAIVGQMARHSAKLTDTERGLIDRAVNMVWADARRGGDGHHRRRDAGQSRP